MSKLPLGIRNNNPLNIRVSSNAWQGKIQSDNAFEKFVSMSYGIRAAVKNLQTYYNKYKLTTVSKIISKWAPANENNTKSYIDYVAKGLAVDKDSILLYNADMFAKLVSVMSAMENGKPYQISETDIKTVIKDFNLF